MSPSPTETRQRTFQRATLILAAVTVVVGMLGILFNPTFETTWQRHGAWVALTDLVFDAASLLVLAEPTQAPSNFLFGTARITAILFALTAASTIILGVSQALSTRLALRRIRRYSRRHPEYAHSVVFGSGPLALQLIRDVKSEPEGRSVIAVGDDDSFQEEVKTEDALVLSGDARDQGVRDEMLLGEAKEAFLLSDDDAINLDVAGDILNDISTGTIERPNIGSGPRGEDNGRASRRSLACYVHIGDPAYASLFRAHDLFQAPDDPVDFYVFNARERAARELLLDPDRGVATRFAPDPNEIPHYVIVGFGAAGQAIALETAHLAHFDGLKRPRMTIVDDFRADRGGLGPADEARRRFLARYPAFCPDPSFNLHNHARLADSDKDAWHSRRYHPACRQARREEPAIEYVVNAEFLDAPAEDPDLVQSLIDRFSAENDTQVRPTIVVCFDDDGRSFRTAYRLKQLLNTEAPKRLPQTPIFAYLPTEEGLAELIETNEENLAPLYAFGSRTRVTSYAQVTRPKIQALARLFHEDYRRQGGDAPPWEKLSYAFRLSNEDAAAHGAVKLRTAGYRWDPFDDRVEDESEAIPAGEANISGAIDRLARMEHNRFVAERLLGGWRYEPVPDGYERFSAEEKRAVRAEMKDRNRRPSIVPFESLLDEDVPKDHQQIQALPRLLDKLGETFTPIPNETSSKDSDERQTEVLTAE